MPSNAGIFMREVMAIASFDFFDFSDAIHYVFGIDATEVIDINFEQLGFESQYFLVNLGTMALFYLIYILGLLLAPMIR